MVAQLLEMELGDLYSWALELLLGPLMAKRVSFVPGKLNHMA